VLALAAAARDASAQPAQAATAASPAVAPPVGIDVVLAGLVEAARAELGDATIAVYARDLHSGRELFALEADTPLNPASNVKLVTTAAALELLGPEHRYATRAVVAADTLREGTVRGDLWLVGGGDPNLTTADLYELASSLHARGVRKVQGRVRIDATAFDGDGLPPGYDQKDELASYRAPAGAASVNFNTFVVHVTPATAGNPAKVAVDPPVTMLPIEGTVATEPGARRRVTVELVPEGERVRVRVGGSIGVDAAAGAWRYPVSDPSRYAGEVFALVLGQRGIKVERKDVRTGPQPDDAEQLAAVQSAPLSVLVRAVNKLSNNFMAEQILKTLAPAGRPATDAAALARVRAWLDAHGIVGGGLRYGNGSGLYDNNRFTARQLTSVLAAANADFRYGADFLASLAVMGADGTTRERLAQTPAARWVRAKTGTLDGISALSGYVGAEGRAPVAFAVVMNGLPKHATRRAKQLQDDIALALAAAIPGN
jgi:D-alanyl-D-alanine carboxypeptidase/D-alanyl-D-alanine-endopeptidase (penicillin-binding protein 4)